jgi:hypothetical protein
VTRGAFDSGFRGWGARGNRRLWIQLPAPRPVPERSALPSSPAYARSLTTLVAKIVAA